MGRFGRTQHKLPGSAQIAERFLTWESQPRLYEKSCERRGKIERGSMRSSRLGLMSTVTESSGRIRVWIRMMSTFTENPQEGLGSGLG